MNKFPLCALTILAFVQHAPAAENDTKTLPPPDSEKVYTFQKIEEQKAELKNKVIRLEIASLLGSGSEQKDGMVRYMTKDTSGGAAPYGQLDFPRDGLQKSGLADNPKKGPQTLYVRVRVFAEDRKAAAICIAVGTHVSVADGKATYSW